MNFTIDTINQWLFPPFLFLVYFGFICSLYHNSKPEKIASPRHQPTHSPLSYREAFSPEFDPTPDSSPQLPALIHQLTKRQLRKLCLPLGIQQKTNGVEKTANLLRKAICRKCQESPQQVLKVIRQRLPDLPLPVST